MRQSLFCQAGLRGWRRVDWNHNARSGLAEHYQTAWVPEYRREYCEKMPAAGVDLWNYRWQSAEYGNRRRAGDEINLAPTPTAS